MMTMAPRVALLSILAVVVLEATTAAGVECDGRSAVKIGTAVCVAAGANTTWTREGMSVGDRVGSAWVEHASCAPPDLFVTPAGHAWAVQSGLAYSFPADVNVCDGAHWIQLALAGTSAGTVCGTDDAAVVVTTTGAVMSRRNVSATSPAGTAWGATGFAAVAKLPAASCAMTPNGTVWVVDRTGGAWVSPADPTGDYARWIHDTNSSITGKGKSVASNVHESIGVVMISANDAGQAVAVDGQGKLWLRQGISPSTPAGTAWAAYHDARAVGVVVSVSLDAVGTLWVANASGVVLAGTLDDSSSSLAVVSIPGDDTPSCARVSASFGRPAPAPSVNVLPEPACVDTIGDGSVAFVDFPAGVSFKWIPTPVGQPTCDVLTAALDRYTRIIASGASPLDVNAVAPRTGRTAMASSPPAATVVEVRVASLEPSPRPSPDMDESYTLLIGSSSADEANGVTVSLSANTVWGALRGLETLSQLAQAVPGETPVARRFTAINITDWPRFAYRGLMVDPARRFLPMSALEAVIDSMVYAKLNVLHMHMTDDQSWPLVLSSFPLLAERGAFSPNHTYTLAQLDGLIEFARMRGVRVLLEIDMPGHSSIVALGKPDVMTRCPGLAGYGLDYSNLDPTSNATYEYIAQMLTEVTSTFTDPYFFIGGDEVSTSCWAANANVTSWMQRNGIALTDLQPYFEKRLIEIARAAGKQVIAWQEVFQTAKDPVGTLGKDAVISVWKGDWQDTMAAVTAAGMRAVLSNCWYLDIINADTAWGKEWTHYYQCDPTAFNGTAAQKALVMGGHAAIWGEACDATNILPRVWPRLAAVAEKLWSSQDFTQGVGNGTIAGGWFDLGKRMHTHRCRLLRRNIAASPVGSLGDSAIPDNRQIGPGSYTYCPEDNRFAYTPPYAPSP